MKIKKASQRKEIHFGNFLVPDYLLFCEEVLFSRTQSNVSYVSLIDALRPRDVPVVLGKFFLVAAFFCLPKVSNADLQKHHVRLQVVIENPAGIEVDLGIYDVAMQSEKARMIYRLILDFTDELMLKAEGMYKFSIIGLCDGCEPVTVLSRPLAVRCKPLREDAAPEQASLLEATGS